MANTHGESSMEEFAAKALPELEELLRRFKQADKPEEPEEPDDANATKEPDDDTRNTDRERIEELAHIIWHLAGQIADIAYHGEDVSKKVMVHAYTILFNTHDIRKALYARPDDENDAEDF